MKIKIRDTFWITGRGFVAVLNHDLPHRSFRINQTVKILDNDKLIKETVISGLEGLRNLNHDFLIKGILLRGSKEELFDVIRAGMEIEGE